MKKLMSILLAAAMLIAVFAGCTADKKDDENVTESTLPSGQVTTADAKIKDSDAINYIKNYYTVEELGLQDVAEDYSIMVASNGYEHDGGNYVKVVANIVTQNENSTSDDGTKAFSMKTVGEYLISFDGTKVLKKDMNTNKYSEMENRIADYSAKGSTENTTEAE